MLLARRSVPNISATGSYPIFHQYQLKNYSKMKNSHIQVKTYQGIRQPNAVYVLSRGLNSGKPLEAPCPNCFQIVSPNPMQAKAVARILFESGTLRPYLHGSVIEFVCIDVYRTQFITIWESLNPDRAADTINKLDAIDKYLSNLTEQLKKIKQLRHYLAISAIEP